MEKQKIIAPENMVQTEASVKKTDTVQTEGYGIFTILKHNQEYRITIGRNIISREVFKKKNDVKKYIDSKPWELMLNTFALVAHGIVDDKLKYTFPDVKADEYNDSKIEFVNKKQK